MEETREEKIAEDEAAQEWFQKAYATFCAKEKTAKNADYFPYRIGKLYSFGYGVEQDYGKAAQWYKKADGNSFALYSLGILYTWQMTNSITDWDR